jgi:hypothetical protein
MKKHLYVLLILLSPIFAFSQNVGIGTTTPDFKLDVESLIDARARIYSPSSGFAGFLLDNNLQQYFIGVESYIVNSRFAIYDNTAGALRFQISTTGNVGIGNITTPSAKLEVEGGIKADSLDVQSGLIKNVADPVSAQDAATKAYVDLLESTVDLLEAKLDSLIAALYIPVVGDSLAGGVVFYIFQPGDAGYVVGETHGLIVSLDEGDGQWGCYATDLPSVPNVTANPTDPETVEGARIGDGETNTDGIGQDCPSGYAADWCRDKGPEWFLPSRDELNELYKWYETDKPGNNNILLSYGGVGFAADYYWSSTEYDYFYAWGQLFINGSQLDVYKDGSHFVRAVRAF